MSFHIGSRPSGNLPWAVFNADFPSAFTDSQWLVSEGLDAGVVNIIIITTPSAGGLLIQDIEYRIDGGSPASLNAKSSGVYTISGFEIGQELDIELRVITRKGAGAWGDLKTITITDFSPISLFALSEPGVWYDPSDLTTMFQDRAGTTLVTTPGQSVGLVLDKSQGLVLGPELVTNGTFDTDTAWAKQSNWSIGGGVATYSGTGADLLSQNIGAVNGRTYLIEWTSTAFVRFRLGSSSTNVFEGIGNRAIVRASGTDGTLYIRPPTAPMTIDNISVREIPGNHMVATADASRGTYGIEPFGGRRNLLTFTEQFDNAVWVRFGNATITVNQDTAPDGTLTADLYDNGVTLLSTAIAHASNTVLANTNYTFSLYAKRVSGAGWLAVIFRDTDSNNQFITWFDINTGAVGTREAASGRVTRETQSIQAVGDYYRISVSGRTSGTNFIPLLFLSSEDGSRTRQTNAQAYLWGAQLEVGSTATPYQRVTTAFDVTEAGVPTVHYVQFDGADDGYLTSTITPGTDKVQVFAGVQKLSDAVARILIETSVNASLLTSAGSFFIAAPLSSSASERYGFLGRGSATPAVGHTATLATASAPDTAVLTAIGDIAADLNVLRRNGVAGTNATLDQGTGNYLAYPLYIGRRGGTSLPFNGRLYQMVVRFGPNLDASRIEQVERFINSKTGAY